MSSAIPIRKQNTRGSAIFAGSTWETKWLRIYGYESSSKTRRKKLALRNCCFVVHCTSVYALILVARLSTDVFRACLASFGLVSAGCRSPSNLQATGVWRPWSRQRNLRIA